MEEKVIIELEKFMDIVYMSKAFEKDSDELDELLDLIFDNVELNYDNELRFFNTSKLTDYLKIKENYRYEKKLEELKRKKEVK